MGLRINNNIAALNSYNNVNRTDKAVSSSLEKLSSGFRINKAADDASGLVISEGLRSQIGGLTVAARSAQDGVNVAQTADGALGTVTTILQRMRDLATQSVSDTNSVESRGAAKAELDQLAAEVDRIASKTSFNGVALLDGNYNGKSIQVGSAKNDTITLNLTTTTGGPAKVAYVNGGATATAAAATFALNGTTTTTAALTASTDANDIATQLNNDTAFKAVYVASVDKNTGGLVVQARQQGGTNITIGGGLSTTASATAPTSTASGVSTGGFSSSNLGVNGLVVSDAANAGNSLTAIDNALKAVTSARANVGATQNRFEYAISAINVSIENLTASESAIRDTDMAAEMTKFTKNQILSQAGTSMLAQANSSTQNILTLLRG